MSGGTLTLTAGQLNTQGTLQGEQERLTLITGWVSRCWAAKIQRDISNELHNTGSLMSQNTAQVTANSLNNSGSLLSEGAMVLTVPRRITRIGAGQNPDHFTRQRH